MDRAQIIESFRQFVEDGVEVLLENQGKVFAFHQIEFLHTLAGRLLSVMDSMGDEPALERMALMKELSKILNLALERLHGRMKCS